ncbi:hypothetical protein [Streptomyces goshikiensis]|uniref:hypothetical protein n=1 Tax=Streptomyces goshikiensis TaxID=1942 RepID=UPI00367B3B7A
MLKDLDGLSNPAIPGHTFGNLIDPFTISSPAELLRSLHFMGADGAKDPAGPLGDCEDATVESASSRAERKSRAHSQLHLPALYGTSSGVIFEGDIDSEASDYLKRVRVEVKLEVVSRSFAIVHIDHMETPLAHFNKIRKAFRGPDRRLAMPLQSPHSPPTDTQQPCCRNWVDPDLEMRSRN